MKTAQVDVSLHNNDEFRVSWSDWTPYTVHRQTIESCAEEIRSVLLELVNHRLKNDLRTAAPILKKLARKGSQLYRALFTKIGGDEDPERIKSYYAAFGEELRIDFRVSNSVFVPWGLVYPSDPALLPDTWDGALDANLWNAYRDFWCFSRHVTTRYMRIRPDEIGDASSLEMLRIINTSVFGAASKGIVEQQEKDFIDWLEGCYGAPISAEAALERAWQDKASTTGLIYFYCHASATTLAIGADAIAAHRLFLLLADRKRESRAGCLVLINGCRTAVGDSKGAFLLSTSTHGLCGFVGTETDVPDVFALRFSTSLLHLLFHGNKTLGEAMQRLYRDHFPLSLIYGVYAHPDFRMSQQHAPDIAVEERKNFSDGVVGTGRLEAEHVL